MAIILEHAPVAFRCARCGWQCTSFAVLAEHIYLCCGLAISAPLADNSTAPESPTVALDLTHRPARPLASRARRRPAVEIELAPSEAVSVAVASEPMEPDAPPTPRKHVIKHRYCVCGVMLPSRAPERCPECGRAVEANR